MKRFFPLLLILCSCMQGVCQTNNNFPFEITKVEFGNTDNNNKILHSYGTDLYASKMRFLSPKIYYDGKESKKITLYYKIISPDGTLIQGSSSPSGYTKRCENTISSGQNKNMVVGSWGSKSGGVYVPGLYQFEIWYEGRMAYQTNLPLYKTSAEKEMERNFAGKAFMEIKKVEFGNTDNGNVITPYGSTLYASRMHYLAPKIYYNGKCVAAKKTTIYVKIVKPDGTISKGSSSPDGYTFKSSITVSPGQNNTLSLSGWGSSNGGTYTLGTYRYELWCEGKKFYETNITFYKTPAEKEQELASNAYMDIKKIEFGNVDNSSNIITPHGTPLYTAQVRFISPKIYYDGKCKENKKITLYYKLFNPSGALEKGTSSPEGYTSKYEMTVYPGQNKSKVLTGWGTQSGGHYKSGTYRYELWYNGHKVYQTNFTINQSTANQQNNNTYASNKTITTNKTERELQNEVTQKIKSYTMKDIFPNETFPMRWTSNFAGMVSLNTVIYENGLVEISGTGNCLVCHMTGTCQACYGTKGRWMPLDVTTGQYYFYACGGCGGTGKCRSCNGTGSVQLQKQYSRLDPNDVNVTANGDISVPISKNGTKENGTCSTRYKYTTCSMCNGTGKIDGDVPAFGLGSKWCDKCKATVPISHCHGCKICPKCGGKRIVLD